MRGRQTSIVANPVLVGAVTTLVVIVAVFLAYNANNGLPFVPTRQYKVDLENGSNLVKGNEVRSGGFRVGVVTDLRPITRADGKTIAELKLKLDKKTGTVPVDSTITIRPRSALGLKYLELNKGNAKQNLRDGDLIPLSRTKVPVQFDDLNKLFDEKTRKAAQDNLVGFGNAFTGRGQDLNVTISQLPALFGYLQPVASNLASPQTALGRFFRALGTAAGEVAPVAGVNAQLFTDMGTTFEAISRDPEALKATISKSPPTLDVSIRSLRVQRPFLNDVAAFSVDFRGAVRSLREALPIINPALEEGTPVLLRTPAANLRLRDVFAALDDLVKAPGTNRALRGLIATVTTLNPQLRFLGPYQTVCDYWNYFWTYTAEHFSETDPTGSSERALLNSSAGQTNSVGTAGAYEPVNGEGYPSDPIRQSRGDNEHLHGQPYGAAINHNGTADCENGQRGFPQGNLALFAGPRDLQGNPWNVVTDPHTPGSQGPTYKGRDRVPAGETFTRNSQTGTQLPFQLTTGVYGG